MDANGGLADVIGDGLFFTDLARLRSDNGMNRSSCARAATTA